MNAEIYQISFSQFAASVGKIENESVVLSAAKLANEILVVMFDNKPICFVGLVPPTLLSDSIYVWMITTNHGEKHPFIFGKYGKQIMQVILCKYRIVFGDCFTEKSANWLKRIGAEFTSETRFEFRRV